MVLRGRPSPILVSDPIPAASGLCSRNEGQTPARVQMGLRMSAGRRTEPPTPFPPRLTGSLDSAVHPILQSAPTAPSAANAWKEGPGESAPAEVPELGSHSPHSLGEGLEALREARALGRRYGSQALAPQLCSPQGSPQPRGAPHLPPPLCYRRPEGSP